MTTHHRRVRPRWALALALLLILLLAGGGIALAQWMARASNPGNTFTAATLRLWDSLEGSPIVGGAVAPGTVLTGTVTITNGASAPASITLGASHLAPGNKLAGALVLDVVECGPTCALGGSGAMAYSGTLDALSTVVLAGNGARGLWAAGEVHRYLFSATLPLTSTDSLMGQSTSIDFVWTATSS